MLILKSGTLTTIQDGGRYGYQAFGIPVSGFMDVTSAQQANKLVNNPPKEALIEFTQVGAKIAFSTPAIIAITGAFMGPTINGVKINQNETYFVHSGDVLSFGVATLGIRTYLAIQGGIQLPVVLGSKSTYLPANIGGYQGRNLLKGDELEIGKVQKFEKKFAKQTQVFNTQVELHCVKGPEWHLFSERSKQHVLTTSFLVGKDIDRMGYRLEGASVKLPRRNEIVSSGIVRGTVQITKSGQPIIMMADAPTTGGYLRILNLLPESCDKLAQLYPGCKVRFTFL